MTVEINGWRGVIGGRCGHYATSIKTSRYFQMTHPVRLIYCHLQDPIFWMSRMMKIDHWQPLLLWLFAHIFSKRSRHEICYSFRILSPFVVSVGSKLG